MGIRRIGESRRLGKRLGKRLGERLGKRLGERQGRGYLILSVWGNSVASLLMSPIHPHAIYDP